VLVVRGEPGVGKTALLDYRVKQVSGCRVGRATGVQSDMEFTAAQVQQLEHDQTQSKLAANPGGSPMSDLLQTVIEAHGGLEHWNQLNSVSARLIQGGALWALKGQAGVLDDVVVTASLHQERVSHRPFGAADRHSSFTPQRVAIETDDGTVLEALDQPREPLIVSIDLSEIAFT
jgi:hypothetical protein